jgi:hypothetical protein
MHKSMHQNNTISPDNSAQKIEGDKSPKSKKEKPKEMQQPDETKGCCNII